MYIDNYCISQVTTDNNYYASQYKPINNTEEKTDTFEELLSDTINEAIQSNQVYSESTNVKSDEIVDTNVNTTYPMDSVPPVIKTQEPAESSYISGYYPIPSTEVIPTIREVRQVINNTDMSGKSDIEKYNFIEGQFINAFGKDFMIARDLFVPSSMFYMIGVEFNDTLGRHITNPEQVNRQRLHGNANTEAIQDTIRSNFPAELTNRDLFMMVGQMRNEGVLDSASVRSLSTNGSRRLMDTLALIKNYARFQTMPKDELHRPMSMEERDRSWMSMLKKPISIHDLLGTFNVWKQYGRVDIGQDAAPFLTKFMGGKLGANGLFMINANDDIDWNRLMDMMFAEFNEYDDLIRNRLLMIGLEDHPDTEKDLIIGDDSGAEEGLIIGDDSGTEEGLLAGESAGAEENMDTGDNDNQNNDGVADGNPEAA